MYIYLIVRDFISQATTSSCSEVSIWYPSWRMHFVKCLRNSFITDCRICYDIACVRSWTRMVQ